MAKNTTTIREFIEVLGELYGPMPGGTAPEPAGRMGFGAEAASDPELDEPDPGHVNYNRLARVFARDPAEAGQVAMAIRRFMTGQHLTLEMKGVLLDQFRKVLNAAESDHSVLHRLERMIMPHGHGGGGAAMTTESAVAVGSIAARLGRMLLPHSAGVAKQAIEGLKAGQTMPSGKIKVLLSLLSVMIEVFEQNPEMLNTLQSKVRGIAAEPAAAEPAVTQPAVGQPVAGQPLMGAAGQPAAGTSAA